MFKFFNRKKKVKILVVVNGDASIPVVYCSKIDVKMEVEVRIDVKMEVEVRVACNSLGIAVTEKDFKSIIDTLCHGEAYWLNETWGFQVIEVEV